jgi:hypothetical protein
VSEVVLRAMSKSAADRQPSVDGFMQALSAAARPTTTRPVAPRFAPPAAATEPVITSTAGVAAETLSLGAALTFLPKQAAPEGGASLRLPPPGEDPLPELAGEATTVTLAPHAPSIAATVSGELETLPAEVTRITSLPPGPAEVTRITAAAQPAEHPPVTDAGGAKPIDPSSTRITPNPRSPPPVSGVRSLITARTRAVGRDLLSRRGLLLGAVIGVVLATLVSMLFR